MKYQYIKIYDFTIIVTYDIVSMLLSSWSPRKHISIHPCMYVYIYIYTCLCAEIILVWPPASLVPVPPYPHLATNLTLLRPPSLSPTHRSCTFHAYPNPSPKHHIFTCVTRWILY